MPSVEQRDPITISFNSLKETNTPLSNAKIGITDENCTELYGTITPATIGSCIRPITSNDSIPCSIFVNGVSPITVGISDVEHLFYSIDGEEHHEDWHTVSISEISNGGYFYAPNLSGNHTLNLDDGVFTEVSLNGCKFINKVVIGEFAEFTGKVMDLRNGRTDIEVVNNSGKEIPIILTSNSIISA